MWGIVNNAGLSSFGEVEWVPMATYRKIMDVNMFGLMRGIQVCLPLIRRSQGRIVSTTSGLAFQAVPTRSPYVFTKYALAGFLDVLRYEMETFGVKVIMCYVHMRKSWSDDKYFGHIDILILLQLLIIIPYVGKSD